VRGGEGGTPSPTPREARLRADLPRILASALDALDPAPLVTREVRALEAQNLLPGGDPTSGSGGGAPRLALVAVGKAAVPMARGALEGLGPTGIDRGLVLAPEWEDRGGAAQAGPGIRIPWRGRGRGGGEEGLPFPVHRGGHPLPTRGSVQGARAVARLIRGLGPGDTLLFLLSGGGSALLTEPRSGLSLESLRRTTRLLLEAGASIEELNAVRKHLERLKGGGLAAEAGSRIVALVVSDVVGSPPHAIASGPVSPDPTTFADAMDALARYGLTEAVPPSVRSLLEAGLRGEEAETPKPGDERVAGVEYRIVADVETAIDAARRSAAGIGYRTHLLTSVLEGEARVVGRRLGALARALRPTGSGGGSGRALIAGGETTVRVVGSGRGGRNQELALGAALELARGNDALVASLATDGVDGPTDAAGAAATGSTLARARSAGLDPQEALARNDAYPFFGTLGDLLRTGPTGTNVMDLQVVLVGRG